jgi:hypothetical protein
MAGRVFYQVADLDAAQSGCPFAVVAIYPDRPHGHGKGCLAIVESLHGNRAEAEAAAKAHPHTEAGEA